MSEPSFRSLQREKGTSLVEKVRTVGQIKLAKYFKFQNRYRTDRTAFVHDCFNWDKISTSSGPTLYQEEILNNFLHHDRQAVRGPRGMGKTFLAACCTHHFALVWDGEDDWRVPTTASRWRQLEEFLWPEVKKLSQLLRWDVIGREPYNSRTELMTMKLRLNTGMALAMSSDESESLEGLHATRLFCVFDESKIIPTETWNALEGMFVATGLEGTTKLALAISTPGSPIGVFWDIHRGKMGYEDWYVRHVTKEETIAAGRMAPDWPEKKRRQWGVDSEQYQQQVLGEFAEADEDTIIQLAWVEAAFERHDQWSKDVANGSPKGQLTSIGADIGGGGSEGDSSIISRCYDERIIECEGGSGGAEQLTMEVAGKLKGLIQNYNARAYIDVIGVGLGVYDRLLEQGIDKAIAFNAAEKPPKKYTYDSTKEFKFANKRTCLWWMGRELLDPKNRHDIALPRSDRLSGELTAPKKAIKSNAVMFIENKKEIRRRLHRSTDMGDSVLMALLGPKICAQQKAKIYVVGEGYVG